MKIDKTLINSYPFTIRPLSEEDGGGFAIEYPDLPGCISDGDTPEELIEQHLSRPLPPVSSLRPELPAGLDAVITRAAAKPR